MGRIWVRSPGLWLAMAAITRTNTSTGATAFRAMTKSLPSRPTVLAYSGEVRARTMPASRPMMIRVTRLVRFKRCRMEPFA
ncbi:hypothetical protein D3C78_393350 [compost metagenome]